MIRLKGTLTTLEAVLTSDTGNELDVVCSFGNIKFTAAELTDLDSTAQKTTGTTAITLAGPAASATETIGVEQISAYNDNGSAHTVKIQLNDGTSTFVIKSELLQPGDALVYDNGWTVEKKNNVESSGNNTTSQLAASAEFVGEWERVDTTDLFTAVFTDVRMNIWFEFSDDLTHITQYPGPKGFPVCIDFNCVHTAVKAGRYFRIRVHNGITASTKFRAFTYFGKYRQLQAPVQQAIAENADASVTRPTDFQDEVLLDRRNGVHEHLTVAERTTVNIADGDALMIGDNTTNTPTVLTAPDTFDIVYTPASDGLGTNGALTLLIEYLDENGESAEATHTLGNTGTDTTSFTGYGINKVLVTSVGAATAVGNANVAAITFQDTTGGGVINYVAAGSGITDAMVYYTPFNAEAIVKHFRFNGLAGVGNPELTFKGWVYIRETEVTIKGYDEAMDTQQDNRLLEDVDFPLPPGSVAWATCATTANGASVSGRMNIKEYNTGEYADAPFALYPPIAIGDLAIAEGSIGGNS